MIVCICSYGFVFSQTLPVEPAGDCSVLPDKLKSCEPYECSFVHPFNGQTMKRKVVGMADGKCVYTEEMPNNGLEECKLSQDQRTAIAQYYADSFSGSITDMNASFSTQRDSESKYTVNGKEKDNPIQEYINSDVCVIKGW